jgi:ribose 5-phosphate isomerase RpiB
VRQFFVVWRCGLLPRLKFNAANKNYILIFGAQSVIIEVSIIQEEIFDMKIALINENSQAAKNEVIVNTLKKVVEPLGHEVFNYGMYTADDAAQLTYVQIGILAAILLNSGAADLVITGCGTGEGACLACNAFPGVLCGHVVDPTDAYQFTQVNNGNCIAMPFAKGWGWGAELNLQYVIREALRRRVGRRLSERESCSGAEKR